MRVPRFLVCISLPRPPNRLWDLVFFIFTFFFSFPLVFLVNLCHQSSSFLLCFRLCPLPSILLFFLFLFLPLSLPLHPLLILLFPHTFLLSASPKFPAHSSSLHFNIHSLATKPTRPRPRPFPSRSRPCLASACPGRLNPCLVLPCSN